MSDSALWRFFRSIRAASAGSAGAVSVAAASAGANAGAGADAGAADAVIFTSGVADAGAVAEGTVASGTASLVGGADAVVISVAVATDDASADCAGSAGESTAADGAAVEDIASAGGAKVEGSVAAAVAVAGVVGCVSSGGAAAVVLVVAVLQLQMVALSRTMARQQPLQHRHAVEALLPPSAPRMQLALMLAPSVLPLAPLVPLLLLLVRLPAQAHLLQALRAHLLLVLPHSLQWNVLGRRTSSPAPWCVPQGWRQPEEGRQHTRRLYVFRDKIGTGLSSCFFGRSRVISRDSRGSTQPISSAVS